MFIDFWKKCADYIIELNKKGVRIRERTMVIILSKILGQQDAGYTDMRSPCGACLSQLAYDYDGSIYSCDEGRDFDIFKVGNVSQEYPEVVGCDKSCMIISSSVISNTSCDECVWKPYCGICPVIGFSETNSLIPSVSEHFRCKVHDAQFNYIFEKIQDSEFQKIVKSWISL